MFAHVRILALTFGVASCDHELSVLFNTNRPLRSTVPAGFVVHRGWWFDNHSADDLKKDWQRTRNLTHNFMKLDSYIRPKARELPMVYKHAWLATLDRRQLPEPWLVFDTDTIVQCSPSEFRARFRRFGTPLVVGAEGQWWPDPHRSLNPWPAPPGTNMRYPNSGFLMGTAAGFAQLRAAFANASLFPDFPCCPRLIRGADTRLPGFPGYRFKRCMVNEQLCVQSALQAGQQPGQPQMRYALDVNSTLVFNAGKHGRAASKLMRSADGRAVLQDAKTGAASGEPPCVLHFPGMTKDRFAEAAAIAGERAWIIEMHLKHSGMLFWASCEARGATSRLLP